VKLLLSYSLKLKFVYKYPFGGFAVYSNNLQEKLKETLKKI